MRSGLPAFAHSHRRACKALADPARVKIMSYLFSSSSGEENSGDLAAALRLTESTVSHHLTQLRRAGLVESERRGMNVYHRPHRDAVGATMCGAGPQLLHLAESYSATGVHC